MDSHARPWSPKCHVKDFKLSRERPGNGKFVNIRRHGSVSCRPSGAALDKIGYNGWLSIEGGDLSPRSTVRRLI